MSHFVPRKNHENTSNPFPKQPATVRAIRHYWDPPQSNDGNNPQPGSYRKFPAPKTWGEGLGGRMWWNMWNLKSSKNMYLPVSFLWKVEDFFVTNFVLDFFLVKGEWHPRVKHENSWNQVLHEIHTLQVWELSALKTFLCKWWNGIFGGFVTHWCFEERHDRSSTAHLRNWDETQVHHLSRFSLRNKTYRNKLWWVVSNFLKNIGQVGLISLSRGDTKKHLKPPPRTPFQRCAKKSVGHSTLLPSVRTNFLYWHLNRS